MVFLVALFSLAVFYSWTIFIPLCCFGMALLILGAVAIFRQKADEDERKIVSTLQKIFPERLTESHTLES